MSPRRVADMTYEVVWLTGASPFTDTRVAVTLGDFDCVLDGSTLTATPRTPYRSCADAEAALAPLLHGWEYDIEFPLGYRLEFRYGSCSEIAEGQPCEPVQRFVQLRGTVSAAASVALSVSTSLPPPSGLYRPSPRVEQLVTRLRDLREGREKVAPAAYAILTDIEHAYGADNRGAAARALNVSTGLLKGVSRLSSGQHPTEGRKVAKADPLTPEHLDWLRRAVPLLVQRAAAVESGATDLPQLTLDDV